jgi:hypothetical protein
LTLIWRTCRNNTLPKKQKAIQATRKAAAVRSGLAVKKIHRHGKPPHGESAKGPRQFAKRVFGKTAGFVTVMTQGVFRITSFNEIWVSVYAICSETLKAGLHFLAEQYKIG